MNEKVDLELRTVASAELQAEIDETLRKLDAADKENKSEDSQPDDGDGSNCIDNDSE